MGEKPLAEDSLANVVLYALDLCERDFAFIGGCTMTDMPHVPLSPETSWKMDFARQLAAIADARVAICQLAAARTACECRGCGTPLQTGPTSTQSIPERERQGTNEAAGGSA